MWDFWFYDADTKKVSNPPRYLELAAIHFLGRETTDKYVDSKYTLQYPAIVKHPFPSKRNEPLRPQDLKLCIFTDKERKSCLFTDFQEIQLEIDEPLLYEESPFVFEHKTRDGVVTYKFSEVEAKVLFGWLRGYYTPYKPHDHVILRKDAGKVYYVALHYPKLGIDATNMQTHSYPDPPSRSFLNIPGYVTWTLKYSQWKNLPEEEAANVDLLQALHDWVKKQAVNFKYEKYRLKFPARIRLHKESGQWLLNSGNFWREQTDDLFLDIAAEKEDAFQTPAYSPFHLKYQGLPDNVSKAIAEWASQRSRVSKHDVFLRWDGNVYALRMPKEYDPYDRSVPIEATNITKNQAVSFWPEKEAEEESPRLARASREPTPKLPPSPREQTPEIPELPPMTLPSPPPPPRSRDAPLRKRDLQEYKQRSEAEKAVAPPRPTVPDTSSIVIADPNAPVSILRIAASDAQIMNRFRQWIENGTGELKINRNFRFSYPAKIGKFSASSTKFHVYATSAVNELEMIYSDAVPLLVLGNEDTGMNIVYRWENGNEFSRLESQAIYAWKQGKQYMHQIMYVSANYPNQTFILDYATNSAVLYIEDERPIKINFKVDALVVRLKRGKYTQCSICAEPAQWMCLCSKAYYCTEACAAKDDAAHAKC